MITIQLIADTLAARADINLNGWGPTHVGAQNVDRVEKMRRWVWVPLSETTAPAEKRDGTLATALVVVEVHMWGLDEIECRLMRSALLSGLRLALGGRRYSLGASRWTERQDAHRGVALVSTITIELPVPRATLPIAGTIEEAADAFALVEEAPVTPHIEG